MRNSHEAGPVKVRDRLAAQVEPRRRAACDALRQAARLLFLPRLVRAKCAEKYGCSGGPSERTTDYGHGNQATHEEGLPLQGRVQRLASVPV